MKEIINKQGLTTGKKEILKDLMGNAISNIDFNKVLREYKYDKYPSVNRVYQIADNYLIGVDQSNSDDKTCLCFCKIKEGKFHIERFKYIEKQEDMDEYINMNTAKWLDKWNKEFVTPFERLKDDIEKGNVSFGDFVQNIESKDNVTIDSQNLKDKYSCFDIKKIHKTDDGTPVVIELKDKDEELTISTKWDGCIDLNYNDDYIHICNVEDFISKLQEVIKISEEHFEDWA